MDPVSLLVLGALAFVLLQKKKVAPPLPPPVTPTDTTTKTGIPPDLWQRIHNTIQYETDLGKLRALERELQAFQPQTPELEYALTILRQKIRVLEGGAVTPPTPPTPPVGPPTPPVGPPTPPTGGALPSNLQNLLVAILEGLTVQPDDTLTGPVTEIAIQRASSFAGQLDKAGFPVWGENLRQYIILARAYLPKIPKPDITPKPPEIPVDLWARIQETMRLERDPKRLRALLGEMQAYRPESVQMTTAIEALKMLIASIEAAADVADTITDIDKVIPKPDTPPIPPVEEKTAAQIFGEQLALHLLNVQSKFGMPGAKGKEDKKLAESFQKSEGLKVDGKPGPGTTLRIAEYVSNLPLVMYWPVGANKASVADYKKKVIRLADLATGARSDELRASAARETGQGGIS